MTHAILLCLSVAMAVGCHILPSRPVQRVEGQRTFAELSQAEKYAYLSAVLKAQSAKIRATRIARVKSLAAEITHQVNLTAQLVTDGFAHKLIRVSWSPVQADSIELLRCKLKNLTTQVTQTQDDTVVAAGYDFDELETEPNSYGLLSCARVYGRIQNGVSLIDYGAENNFSYVYFFRPCYKNYAVVVPAIAGTDTEQCGEDKITAAENNPASLSTAAKHTLFFRYCQTDARQVCSAKLSHHLYNPIVFNQGIAKLPRHLFDELRQLRAEIEKHEDALYKESQATVAELAKTGPGDHIDMLIAQEEKLTDLQDDHDAANVWRAEKRDSVMSYTGILNQAMAEQMGHEMSFGSRDCYSEYKAVQKGFDEMDKQLAQMPEPDDADTAMGQSVSPTSADTDMQDAKMLATGLAVGGCVANNIQVGSKLIDIQGANPFDDKPLKISRNIEGLNEKVKWDTSVNPDKPRKTGAEFGNAEYGLAAANFAIGMIPLETSELNRGGGIAAFTSALNDIFISEDAYIREHCRPCLDHMAQVKFHSRKIYYLQQRLLLLSEQIQKELLEKGVDDPDKP